MDKECNVALVEGMFVNWTFHRPESAKASKASEATNSSESGSESGSTPSDFLHCWQRPENYLLRLAEASAASASQQGTWEERCNESSIYHMECHGMQRKEKK